jgi:hypothetical protein
MRTQLARWFDARVMELFIDPVLADLQAEYEEALNDGRRWRARWIWTAGYAALARVLLWQAGRRMWRGSPADARGGPASSVRPMAWGVGVAVVVTVAIVANTVVGMNVAGGRNAPILLALLVPQALPVAIPLGMMVAVFAWSRPRERANRRLLPVLSAALGCSLVSFVVLARVAPDANQAFRLAVFDAYASAHEPDSTFRLPPPRGANELTMGQLRSFVASGTTLTPPDDVRVLAFVYHRRWALAAASLVLGAFAFAVAARWGHRRRGMVLVTLAALAGYVVLLPTVGRAMFGGVPAAAAWTPNVALLMATLALAALPLRSRHRPPA